MNQADAIGLQKRNQLVEDKVRVPDKITKYQIASQNWILANMINRDNGQELSPKPEKPTRTVFDVGQDEGQEWIVAQHEEKIEGLVEPELPAQLPVKPSEGFVTHAGETQDTLNTILALVVEIHAKVNSQ